MFENKDLVNLVTPVNVNKLDQLLWEVDYDPGKREFLVDGFQNGFLNRV